MSTQKSLAKAVSAKLSQLARAQAKPYDKLLTLFLLERIVSRLVFDPVLAQALVFKGGYVSVRVYDSPRFTVDVDAVLHGLSQEAALQKIKEQMLVQHPDAAWFVFAEEKDLATQNEYGGKRLSYRAGLGEIATNLQRAQLIDIDIGTGDPVTPAPQLIETTSVLGDTSLSWQVYPVETILAEKLHSLISRGAANSRAKDVFDTGLLLPKADVKTLHAALQATFKYRGDALPNDIAAILEELDTTLLEKGWKSAAGYIAGAGDLKTTLEKIVSWFRKNFLLIPHAFLTSSCWNG